MKIYISTLIIFFSTFNLFSQYKIASKSVMGKKTVITTKYDKGFVVKSNNERLEGTIQLKVVNNDTVEVRFKNEAKEKTKFKRAQLKSFGLISLVSDKRVAKIAEKNFNPGAIVTNNGDTLEGELALRFSLNPGESIGRKWFVHKVLFAKDNGEYITYTAKDIKQLSQRINGVENVYVRYKDGFTKQLEYGDLELFRNPYSTSQNSLATGLIREVQQDLAEEAAKQTLKSAIRNGNGTLEDVKNNYEAVNSADISVSRKEYLVRKKGELEFTVLSKDNYSKWAESYFKRCNSFTDLESKKQKSLTKWANLLEGISFHNKNCK